MIPVSLTATAMGPGIAYAATPGMVNQESIL
jgi:hypothetical protein